MTSNNIAYWNLQETKRHNKETEAYNTAYLGELSRHNLAVEAYNLSALAETNRHNLVVEQETHRTNRENEAIRWYSAEETARSNRANEAIRRESNAIQAAYNQASIQLGYSQLAYQKERDANQLAYQYAQLDEVARNNRFNNSIANATFLETRRTHMENEKIAHNKNAISAFTAGSNAAIGAYNALETSRYHREMAAYNERHAAAEEERNRIGWYSAVSGSVLGAMDLYVDNKNANTRRDELNFKIIDSAIDFFS